MNPELPNNPRLATTGPADTSAGLNPGVATPPDATPTDDPVRHGSLKQRAKRSAVIVVISQFVGQFLRLASNLVLTRLLVPEHFGLMAMVNIFIAGINMFSDIGIRPSIVQNKRGDDPAFLNTAWTMQVIRGFCIWAVACLIAYPIGRWQWLYPEMPMLTVLLPVAGFSAVIMGFQSTKVFTAGRHVMLGREMAMQLGCNFVGLCAMALLAYIYRNVWSLVFGTLIIGALNSLFSHIVFPGPNNRFAWDRECLGELVRFGKWVFLGTVVLFFANNLDRLLLGKLISADTLGVYSIAFMLATTPSTLIKRFGNKVVFPVISRKQDIDRADLTGKLLRNQKRLGLVMAVPVVVLVCAGDWIVELLWTQEYHEAGWMTSILGISLWIAALRTTSTPALLALGKPQYGFWANIGRLVWTGVAAWWGFQLFGLVGFVLAYALSELPAYLVMAYGTSREKIRMWPQDLLLTIGLIVVLAAVILGRYALGGGVPYMPGS